MNKTVRWEGKPTLAAFYHFYLVGALLLGTTSMITASTSIPPIIFGVTIPFACLMFVLPLLFQRAWNFTLTSERVESSFTLWVRRRREAPLEKITNIVVNQGVIGRLLGFGSVRIDTAGTPFPGVKFWGVRDPLKVEEKVRNSQNLAGIPVRMERGVEPIDLSELERGKIAREREGPENDQV